MVVGEREMAVFDDTEPEHKLVRYPHRIDWVDRLPVARKADREIISLQPGEPLRLELQHFLDCVRTRERPEPMARVAFRCCGFSMPARNR